MAERLHRGLYRDSGEPFKKHFDNVVGGLVILEGVKNPYALSAGYLHDTIELKRRRRDTLRGFSHQTRKIVLVLTKKRTESREHYRTRIINETPDIIKIKANDLRHNTCDLWLSPMTGHLSQDRIQKKLADVEFYQYCFPKEAPNTWKEIEMNMQFYERVKKEPKHFKGLFEAGELSPESLLSHPRSEEVALQV